MNIGIQHPIEGYSDDGIGIGGRSPIRIFFDETHVVVELNSPVLLLGMFENFTPGLIIVSNVDFFETTDYMSLYNTPATEKIPWHINSESVTIPVNFEQDNYKPHVGS